MSRADRTDRTASETGEPRSLPGGSSARLAAPDVPARSRVPAALALGGALGLALLAPSPALAGTTAEGEPAHAGRAAVVGTTVAPAAAGGQATGPAAVGQAAGDRSTERQPITEVVLDDTAGIIDPAQLERDLAEIEFRGPVKVAVYTERGASLDHLDDDAASQEFNGRVLQHARAEHPDWISRDGQKWADGLLVYALDPDNRIMGVYAGEDLDLGLGQQESIREAATDAAREAKWTDAAVDAVDEAAAIVGRQWWQNPALYLGAAGGALAVGGAGVGRTVHRRSLRRRVARDIEAARKHLTNVTMDMDATEVNASTVPLDDPHGEALLERFRGFKQRSIDLTGRLDELEQVPEKKRHQTAHLKEAESVRREASELDSLDDAIGDANALLNRHSGWEDAWDRQAAPLVEDLTAADELRGTLPHDVRDSPAALALDSFVRQTRDDLEGLGARLTAESLTPGEALDELDRLRRELTERLDELAEAQVDSYAKTESERSAMRSSMRAERRKPGRARSGSILDVTHDTGFYWRVWSYNAGYSAGRSSVQSSRSSSSSGTGYGSGGGSFSGSGSSGRF